METFQKEFLEYAIKTQVLNFGEFTLKSGRSSPYFFNSGAFNDGTKIAQLGRFYAKAIDKSAVEFDMVYGPAYKGIPLAVSTAMAIAQLRRLDIPFAFNRKEVKDHGEGGNIVGAPLQGKVLIIDDVITAGTSVRESVEIINEAGATPVGVAISLDRQEKGESDLSAVQEVSQQNDIPVISIATLSDLIEYLEWKRTYKDEVETIRAYQQQYAAT